MQSWKGKPIFASQDYENLKKAAIWVLKGRSRQLFLRILTAHHCTRKFTCTSCIERARQVVKWTMIGQMAINIALLGFNDVWRSVTPTFLFRDSFYLQLSPHCSKLNKKSMWVVKKFLKFLSTGNGILPSCSCKARETMVSKCEPILWGTSPVD